MSRHDIENAGPWRIEQLRGLATRLGATQAILFTHSQETGTVIDTWGIDAERSAQAAAGANTIKKDWGWPEDTIIVSAKVQALKEEIVALRKELQQVRQRPPEPHEMLIHYIVGTEHERGWGQRPDGYVAFLTRDDAHRWMKDYYATVNNAPSVPDVYTSYSYVGVMKAGPDTMKRFTSAWYVHASDKKEFET